MENYNLTFVRKFGTRTSYFTSREDPLWSKCKAHGGPFEYLDQFLTTIFRKQIIELKPCVNFILETLMK